MNSRLTLLAVVAVLLAAFAVPALAAPSEKAGNVQGLSTRALAKARLALLTARSAKKESRRAARTAEAAMNAALEAKEAKAIPGPVGPQGPPGTEGPAGTGALPVESDFIGPEDGTEIEAYEALGGPSVVVDVPASGLIEVWAQVTIEGEGAVALFQDGALMPGQSEFCAPEEEGRALMATFETESEEITISTPSNLSLNFFGGGPSFVCGSFGPPAPVLFQTTPGKHTYELRYKASPPCGCPGEPEATFSKRSLFVGPRA